ncbi:hypothetical protein SXCC_03885 [Gluconacetobacter sp. SXCC-1]|nr:hypothetical protein SXCC_03885 [Gluconacetobacter sp. SXCC-1]
MMAAGRPDRVRRVRPCRSATGSGHDRPRAARYCMSPRNHGSSSGFTRRSYSVRMKVARVVLSKKLLFSTPSAMPRQETGLPMS